MRAFLFGIGKENYFKWLETSLVISNIDTCFLPPKTAFSLSSALIMRLFASSCSLDFLMYSQIFLVTSVRGSGLAPITAASTADGVIGFMNAALGLRGAAAFFAAGFLAADLAAFAGAAFFAAGLAAAFFAAGFAAGLAAAFFAAGLAAAFAAGFFTATAFFAAGFLAAGLAADFLAVAIFKPPSQGVLGNCVISRTANSGAVFIGMQVFFIRFDMILRRERHLSS
jgi:hypothetical protein